MESLAHRPARPFRRRLVVLVALLLMAIPPALAYAGTQFNYASGRPASAESSRSATTPGATTTRSGTSPAGSGLCCTT